MFKSITTRIVNQINPNGDLALQIDITNACNLRCSHCYHPNHINDNALKLGDWLKVIAQYEHLLAKIGHGPSLIVCGGEPTISPLFNSIIQRVIDSRLKYQISVLTNATTVKMLNFELLSKLPDLSFQVSLDGANAESHDSVRGKGSFERTVEGIKILKSKGIRVEILAILSKRSVEQISGLFNLAHRIGVDSLGFTRLIVQGSARHLVRTEADESLRGEELKDAFKQILFDSNRTKVRFSPHKPLFRLLHPAIGRNGRFREGLVVDHQGNILASSRSRIKIGHVFTEGLEKTLLTHPLLKSIRTGKIEGCGQCKFLWQCGGDRNVAFAETGNYLGKDPGCWF